jgi:ribonuclease-3
MSKSGSNSDTEDIELYILNPKNKLLNKDIILSIFKKYKLDITDIDDITSYQRAVTHKSYLIRDPDYDKKNKVNMEGKERGYEPLDINDIKDVVPLQDCCYERLEFIGDSTIHHAIALYLYKRFMHEYEGFMTRLRTKLENSDALANLCKAIGLHEYVLISRAMELHNARETNQSILEDAFEAFIGSMHLMYGFDICNKFIISVIEKEIDISEILNNETNHKDTLLQYHHKNKLKDPVYILIEKTGPDHKKNFRMCVKNGEGKMLGIGDGNSKKRGEQAAAMKALINYGVIKNNDNDEESSGDDYDGEISDLEYLSE